MHAPLVSTMDMEPVGKVQGVDVPWTPYSCLQSRGGHFCTKLHDYKTKEGLPELTVTAKHYVRHRPGRERKILPKDEEEARREGPWCFYDDSISGDKRGVQEAWGWACCAVFPDCRVCTSPCFCLSSMVPNVLSHRTSHMAQPDCLFTGTLLLRQLKKGFLGT